MAVRGQRSANTTNGVFKSLGKYSINIEPRAFVPKSRVYSKIKSIEKGTIKVPVPLRKLGDRVFIFYLEESGSLTFGASF